MKTLGVSAIVLSTLGITTLFTCDLSAQGRRGGAFGDFVVKMDSNRRETILAFSRDSEGKRTAHWISFFGMSELKDLKFEDGELSFTRERRNRQGDTIKSTFKGSIEDGKLTGVFSSDQGETKVEGTRRRRMSRAVGNWELKFKVGDREITNALVVKTAKEGQLAVEWKSDRVKYEISGVKFERGKLEFKTKSQMEDRKWESVFEATFRGDAMTGALKSEDREIAVSGKRAGAAAVGTWMLGIESERGDRKQRLIINPDMSGLYGALPIEKVELKDGKLTFKMVVEFGDRKFETDFAGSIKGSELSGNLTTSRGTSKLTGKKVAPRRRRRRQR